MTNKEILETLKRKHKISAFARFLNITPQGLYKLLENNQKHKNQYGNYIEFIKSEFEK